MGRRRALVDFTERSGPMMDHSVGPTEREPASTQRHRQRTTPFPAGDRPPYSHPPMRRTPDCPCESRRGKRVANFRRPRFDVVKAEVTLFRNSPIGKAPQPTPVYNFFGPTDASPLRPSLRTSSTHVANADTRTQQLSCPGVGERYRVTAGHAHQTSNRGANDCRFLIAKRLASTTLKVLTAVQVGATGGT